MDMFNWLISKAMEGNFLFGCNIGGRGEKGLVLTHLLYADDTLIFYGENQI